MAKFFDPPLKNMEAYIVMKFDPDKNIATIAHVNGTTLEKEKEHRVKKLAYEDFKKIIPKIPCSFLYCEEHNEMWFSFLHSKTVQSEKPPTS